MTLLVAILCIGLCVLLGSVMSRSFIKPLYRLIAASRPLTRARGVKGRVRRSKRNRDSDDKYGQIWKGWKTRSGNTTSRGSQKQGSADTALEFQIIPHFLYTHAVTRSSG
jgi:hypothetical protein